MSVDIGIISTNFIAFTINVGDLMAYVDILSETPTVNLRIRNLLKDRIEHRLRGLKSLSIGPGLYEILATIIHGPPAKPGVFTIEQARSDVYKLIEIWEGDLPMRSKLNEMSRVLNELSVKLSWILQKAIER